MKKLYKLIYKITYKDAYKSEAELKDTIKSIYRLKGELTDHLIKTFGIAPEQTTLKLHSTERWIDHLIDQVILPPGDLGLYDPASLTANVWLRDPEQATQVFFHEYFGHGLYFEYTPLGQQIHYLAYLEKKLYEESSDIKSLESKRISKKLDYLLKNTREQNQGFAQWMQWYLSKQTGRIKEFERITNKGKICKKFIEYSKKGEHALMRKCGFTIKK